MTETLSKEHFEAWRSEEFLPHITREEDYEKKVDRLWWIAVTALAVGGAVLSLFMWVLLQKDSQLASLQTETHRLAVSQASVIETVKFAQMELSRQGQAQAILTQTMIDVVKQQGMLHGQLSNGNQKRYK